MAVLQQRRPSAHPGANLWALTLAALREVLAERVALPAARRVFDAAVAPLAAAALSNGSPVCSGLIKSMDQSCNIHSNVLLDKSLSTAMLVHTQMWQHVQGCAAHKTVWKGVALPVLQDTPAKPVENLSSWCIDECCKWVLTHKIMILKERAQNTSAGHS